MMATNSQWCYTSAATDEFVFRWNIINFGVTADEANCLESPKFSGTIGKVNYSWSMKLRHTTSSENISLAIAGSSSSRTTPLENIYLANARSRSSHIAGSSSSDCRGSPRLRAKAVFSLLNKNGGKEYSKESEMQELRTSCELSFPDFIDKKTLHDRAADLLHGNSLRVLCELTVKTNVSHSPIQSTDQYNCTEPEDDLATHFGVVLEGPDEGLYSDFTIKAGEQEFKVHKVLLATRSPVFRAMIDSDMVEGKSNCVAIEDHKPEVVKEMLTYIYTGQAPNIEECVDSLLSIAHQYQLKSLVLRCGRVLCNRLSPENAILTLGQADKYGIKPLKSECVHLICANFLAVKKSLPFMALKTENPELYLELLEAKTQITHGDEGTNAPVAKRMKIG